jgi:hypothetical protein
MTDHMLHIQQSQAAFNGSRDAESGVPSVPPLVETTEDEFHRE